MLKKIGITLIVLLALVVAAGFGAVMYVKPTERLDLRFNEVPLLERALTMIKNLKTSFVLSEADIDNIGKAAIRLKPEYQPGVLITGARFNLEGERLVAHLNLKLRDRLPVGIAIYYKLEWNEPNLVAKVDEAKLRGISLSKGYFDDIVIPLGSQLPELLHIKGIEIDKGNVVVSIRKPTLRELRVLIEQKVKRQAG
ncbi:hypothetical protein [Paenibacillus lignilyticus]|uniref:DUF2993 domain-containing protein n=1 Tax=Paenibacillus lignilyticus TaxID=1172615 RepID=A0ABS5CBB5_9BACL|nr:hypothetical protein [Paenibacillus lignilyticus]MBP3963276.1 hypothetical protein [Paenibacillus lignilyticus]